MRIWVWVSFAFHSDYISYLSQTQTKVLPFQLHWYQNVYTLRDSHDMLTWKSLIGFSQFWIFHSVTLNSVFFSFLSSYSLAFSSFLLVLFSDEVFVCNDTTNYYLIFVSLLQKIEMVLCEAIVNRVFELVMAEQIRFKFCETDWRVCHACLHW